MKSFFSCINSLNPGLVLLFQLFSKKRSFNTFLEGRISSFLLKFRVFNSYFNIKFQFVGIFIFLVVFIYFWCRFGAALEPPSFISCISSPAVTLYYLLSFIIFYYLLSFHVTHHPSFLGTFFIQNLWTLAKIFSSFSFSSME